MPWQYYYYNSPPLGARELCPPQKNSTRCHGKAGESCLLPEKIAHDIMDRQAISVILKNMFPLYPPVFV